MSVKKRSSRTVCAGNLPEFPACLYRPQNYNFIHASTGMDTSTENEPL
nr:MAG TPA: hypothetical protein [Caudoviricetes sp.]